MSNVYARLKNIDINEFNRTNIDVFDARYSDQQSIRTSFAQLFEKHYSYDVTTGGGPQLGIVLAVLSGPQVKNEATTKGRLNTTCLNIDEYPYPFLKERKAGNMGPPVIIKAKVPGQIGDADLPLPIDENDHSLIDLHGEYWQFREDPSLSKIEAGDLVWISFNNAKQPVNISGGPDGKIIGVHSKAMITDIKPFLSPRGVFNPECQGDNSLSAPAPGFFVGHTNKDPNLNYGPPIKKFKGKIKTGMYGNGTPQTKAHFAQALEISKQSSKHKIKGATPGPNNAFIWIGTLKNNGYMDLLDRPYSQGRETIIYAPMTLDLTSPIEIKYYFHDRAGFGHAHINGPTTKVDQASVNADIPGNDFREKIGPAIKDLNKDGRNYILVIPEMSYSRGYGTKNGDIERINKISSGQTVSQGGASGETIRTKINSVTREAVKNYLSGLSLETTKNVLHVTPLREREFATFDGSFTGGLFGEFHQEVLDVVEEHLGTMHDKVEFLSILADGLGSVALASIVNDITVSSTRAEARTSFKNTFFAKPVRIDYVTDSTLDARGGLYGSYFVTPRQDGTLDTVSPSYVIWRNFLIEHSEQSYTEFNYITKPTLVKENYFFDQLGKLKEYSKHAVGASALGSARGQKQKFSFYTVGKAAGPESFTSFHVATKPIDYAFSMINTFLPGAKEIPKKADARTSLKPSFDAVPDHAYALTTKPSASELEKILKRQGVLAERISYFETLIELITSEEEDPCSYPEYKIFCEEDGSILTDGFSLFFERYKKYLDDKKDYMETLVLADGEARIQQIINNKNELIKERHRVMETSLLLLSIEESRIEMTLGPGAQPANTPLGRWKALRTRFNKTNFKENNYIVPGNPQTGYVASIASQLSALGAYEKILKKINYQIEPPPDGSGRLFPESIDQLKPCPPKLGDPLTLGQFSSGPAGSKKSNEPGNNCANIELAVPNTFEELARMIPYYPKKSDFITQGKRSSRTKTRIHEVEGYRTSTFKYPGRTANNGITQKESPRMWACITSLLQRAWKEACEESNYYPFEITNGLRGFQKPNIGGTTAYQSGMSLHSFGLAFDLDPFITGFAKSIIAKEMADPLAELSPFLKKKNVINPPLHSVFTGAWTPGFVDVHGETLHNLGVYKEKKDVLMENAYEAENRPRMAENWREAPSHYSGGGESGGARQKYIKIMKAAKGTPIVPQGTNPTLWIILFCEKTGMKWGNGRFLKYRWKGGKVWSKEEKDKISDIFQIQNVVDRIQAISWNSTQDDHMHVQYWGNRALIYWSEIRKASRSRG